MGNIKRLLASTAMAALLATPALADPAPDAASMAAPTDDNATAEIVVTAQKRSESIQKVPISMQALSAANLEQHQVQSFDDYTKQLPSVSFQSFGPGQSQVFFRGITSGGDGLPFGALATSGVYVDETPVTTIGNLLDIHVYDMQRIEALSGPQGTLYGASSLSGTLRLITNKPEFDKFSAAIDLTGDKYGKGALGGTSEGYINLPLGHHVALRAVGWYEHDGGFIDNTLGTRTYQRPHTDLVTGNTVNSPYTTTNAEFAKNNFNHVDTYGGRLELGIELDDNWTMTPELMGQHQLSHGSFLYDPRVGDLAVHDFAPESNLDKWYQASLTVQGKLSDWDVLYSGSYMGRKIHTQADYSYYTVAYDSTPNANYFVTAAGADIDPTQYFTGDQAMTKQTHEVRVSSPTDKPLRLTAGSFFERQSNQAYLNYYAPGVGQNAYPDWFDGSTVYGDSIFLTHVKIIDRDYAVFGQAAYDITPKLTLSAGVRGFISDNTLTGFSGFSFQAPSTCVIPFPSLNSCSNLDKKAVSSGETHKANLTWQVDPDRMVYFTYSTGFRPGGNNRAANVAPYAPDTLDNFEFGWKTSWLDRKLRINGAVYYEKWHNLQYALIVADSGGITNIYNAGDARVYGAELDVSLHPTKGLTFSAAGAYNNAALSTNFCLVGVNSTQNCSDGITAPKGTRLPVQPRFKVNATARYEFPVGAFDAHVQASMLHQSSSSSFLSTLDNGLVGDSAGLTTADFAVGGSRGKTSIDLFIQNAFDERGSLSHNIFSAPNTSGQYYRIYPIKPQYFGVKLGQKF